MAPKNSNQAAGGKSITDYFSRATRLSPSKRSEGQNTTQQKVSASASISSASATSSHLAPPPENRTRMRSRTPGVSSRVESSSMAKPPSPAKPSGKRKAKFGVDSVSDTGLPVLIVPTASSHVSIPPTPLSPKDTDSRKKVRLSSPASSLEEVPGSVSGEEEMLCEPRRVRAAVLSSESVAKWRAESSPLSDLPGDMEVDEDSKHTAQAEQSVERDATPPYQQLTPPQTTTKTPLNTAAKTQQLIAEIRAKAFAAARSSPTSEEARPFKETLSDSESSEDEFLRGIKGKGKGKTAAPVPTARYNTRSANVQPPSTSKRASVSPAVLPAKSERRKTINKANNPFTALLKQKEEEDRNGHGSRDYLKAADTVLAKNKLLLEMDDEDDGASNETKVDLDDGDRQRLFGDQGEEIKDILDGDREDREAEEQYRTGVPLWKDDASPDDDVAMNAEPALDFGDYRQQPVLRMLYEAFNSADEVRSINLLHSGLLNTVNLEDFGGVINYLCYLALSPAYGDLGSAAFKALLNVWTTSRNRTPGVTLKSVLTAVSGLGARSELLKLNRGKLPTLDHQRRESLVFRLLKLTGVSARLLIPDEMPEILLVLLAIALDSSTSVAIQQEIAIVLNAIFQSIADPNVVAEIEPVICTKIVSFISKIDVANIAYIVNVLAGGPGRGTRVARWVARCVLLGKTRVTEAEYCHTPSIDSLSAILIQGAKTSCQAFQDKKGTDYIAMGYYTQILAIALTDIPNYMPQEIAAAAAFKAENSVQNSPSKEKFETPLQHLHSCIIFLHRKITDHGSNIERSRTKAALLTLAMRLHFQLTAGSRKPSNIQAYLIKKEKGN